MLCNFFFLLCVGKCPVSNFFRKGFLGLHFCRPFANKKLFQSQHCLKIKKKIKKITTCIEVEI